MSKKLKQVSENFIKQKYQSIKKLRSQEVKKQQTVYLFPETIKLAWQNRAETGESLSSLVNRLILKELVKNQTK